MQPEFVPGNRIELLENGSDYFPALRAAIDAARHEVYLETYIFEEDTAGREIADALVRAARRGVAVRLLVDGFGGRNFAATVMPRLAAEGVEVLIYRPDIALSPFHRHRLRRMHRKLAVVDARLAFVGGINIIDDMHTPRHTPPRQDYAVRVEGPLLDQIRHSAAWLWQLTGWANFRRRLPGGADPPPVTARRGDVHAAFIIRDNVLHRRDIEEAYLDAIEAASGEIVIANAYFLPRRRFRSALAQAAARGVKVILLLQGRVEYMLLHYASQALYGSMLAAGIEIHEYHKGFLHAKVAVIDRRWATVGPSNIDPFSLLLAREANVVIRDEAFAGKLRSSLQRAIDAAAHRLEPDRWNHMAWPARAARWIAYGIVKLLVGLAGYGGAR